MNGFGPRLQDVQLAGYAVLGPFYVHRLVATRDPRIVVLDVARPFGKLQHLEASKAHSISLRFNYVANLCSCATISKDHLHFLNAKLS